MTRSQAAAALASFLGFCLGAILVVLPWSDVWNNNTIVAHVPYLQAILFSRVTRGAVTVLGVLNLLIGYTESQRVNPTTSEREPAP